MYVMNCVEVEIISLEEVFEVLFKGKILNFFKKLFWEFDFDIQLKYQNINIFSLFDKKNRIDDIYCVYFILFYLFKKKFIMGKVCMRVYMYYFFFFLI